MPTDLQKIHPLWLHLLAIAYIILLVGLTGMNYSGADRWWFGALNLYLPQAAWAIPGIIISLLFITFARKWVWIPLLCIIWVLGPLMGFCWPLHSSQQSSGGLPLRIMTWNVKYGSHDKFAVMEIIHDIDMSNPAVVLLQDAGGVLNGPLGEFFKKWNVQTFGQYVIASRLPLGKLEVRYISFFKEQHTCVRTEVFLGGETVVLYNVHFTTPRFGLNALREVKSDPWYLPGAIQQLETNVQARHIQAQTLREYISQEKGPVIVAGDLNSPDDSRVSATLRAAGLHDAFAEGGKGYGYTYGHSLLQKRLPALKTSWMRIDHILASRQFQTRDCRVGTANASAHRPVIADLVLGR